jgi:hypothetical protein
MHQKSEAEAKFNPPFTPNLICALAGIAIAKQTVTVKKSNPFFHKS